MIAIVAATRRRRHLGCGRFAARFHAGGEPLPRRTTRVGACRPITIVGGVAVGRSVYRRGDTGATELVGVRRPRAWPTGGAIAGPPAASCSYEDQHHQDQVNVGEARGSTRSRHRTRIRAATKCCHRSTGAGSGVTLKRQPVARPQRMDHASRGHGRQGARDASSKARSRAGLSCRPRLRRRIRPRPPGVAGDYHYNYGRRLGSSLKMTLSLRP